MSKEESKEVVENDQSVPLTDVTKKIYERIVNGNAYEVDTANRFRIAQFIHFGTHTTLHLGAGERAGALNSYVSVFKKFPQTEEEWQDVIKISGGRWPQEKNTDAEQETQNNHFVKIYKRKPDMNNPNDNAAVTVITYGLRPANRNMDSEKVGIKTFEHIYDYAPTSAVDWDIVRAISYSGAVR